MIIFKQHVPEFERGVVPHVYKVETTDELLECPWLIAVQQPEATIGVFRQFSQVRLHDGTMYLIAEYYDEKTGNYSVPLGELNVPVDVVWWKP